MGVSLPSIQDSDKINNAVVVPSQMRHLCSGPTQCNSVPTWQNNTTAVRHTADIHVVLRIQRAERGHRTLWATNGSQCIKATFKKFALGLGAGQSRSELNDNPGKMCVEAVKTATNTESKSSSQQSNDINPFLWSNDGGEVHIQII